MEVTKKKKAYLKPSFTAIGIKTVYNFLQTSGPIRDETEPIAPDIAKTTTQPQCANKHDLGIGGNPQNLSPGSGSWFTVNPTNNSCQTAWAQLGFATGDATYIYRGSCNGVETWWISHTQIDPSMLKCD